MSVINQMLKDLEKREQHAPVSATSPLVSGGRVTRPPENTHFRLLAVIVLLVLILVASGWWFLTGNNPAPMTSAKAVSEPAQIKTKPDVVADEVAVKPQPETPPPVAGAADRLSMVAQQNVPLATDKPNRDASLRLVESPALKDESEKVASPGVVPVDAPHATDVVDDKAVVAAAPKPKPAAKAKIAVAAPPVITPAPPVEGTSKTMAIKEVRLSRNQLAAAKFAKAEESIEAGDIHRAQNLLTQVIAIKPDMGKARARLASLYYGQKNTGKAAQILREGLKVQPGDIEFRLMLARIFQQGKNERQALAYLNQGPLPSAEDVDFHALRGALAQKLKQYADAVTSYRLLAQYQPEQGRWWLGLGIAADGLNDAETAQAAFVQALKSRNLSASAASYAKKRIQQLGGL